MDNKNYINFKPNIIYNVFKMFLFSAILIIFYFVLEFIFPNNLKIIENFIQKNIVDVPLNIFIFYIIAIYSFIQILKIIYIKIFNNYYIDKHKIVIRNGLFKNTVTIPISERLILMTNQSILQFFLNLVTIELEADGDASSIDGMLVNVKPEILSIIDEFKSR